MCLQGKGSHKFIVGYFKDNVTITIIKMSLWSSALIFQWCRGVIVSVYKTRLFFGVLQTPLGMWKGSLALSISSINILPRFCSQPVIWAEDKRMRGVWWPCFQQLRHTRFFPNPIFLLPSECYWAAAARASWRPLAYPVLQLLPAASNLWLHPFAVMRLTPPQNTPSPFSCRVGPWQRGWEMSSFAPSHVSSE